MENQFTNPETRKRFKPVEDFNWNRRIGIAAVYTGHVKDIPPHVAEALIKQGRKDLVEIVPNESQEVSE